MRILVPGRSDSEAPVLGGCGPVVAGLDPCARFP